MIGRAVTGFQPGLPGSRRNGSMSAAERNVVSSTGGTVPGGKTSRMSSTIIVRYLQMAATGRLALAGSPSVGLPTTPSGVPKNSIAKWPSPSDQRCGRLMPSTELLKWPAGKYCLVSVSTA